MQKITIALLALALSGCGAAAGRIPADVLGISARDGYVEARTEARSWDANARLRYVEGSGIAANGLALQGTGEWRFHFTASGRAGEVLVRVTPLEISSEERAATSPPGYVIGSNVLDGSWIDSPAALETVLRARGEAAAAGQVAEMLLVPTQPTRWVVRFPEAGTQRWTVNAETGTLIQGGP